MLQDLWLGILLASGQLSPAAPQAEVRIAAVPENQFVDGHWRNPDFDQIPKVPPPTAKIVYSSINTTQPFVAMTFDDGPHKTNTPRLLDILKERNIKATFFVVGTNAKAYPDIIRRILAEGHEIGNHSWDHKQLSAMSIDRMRNEMSTTDDAVVAASDFHMRLMRPPYGATNLHIKQICLDQFHYQTILWDVDPLDWKRPGTAVVEQRIEAGVHNGAIILSHDIHEPTIDAMSGTLDTLLSRGFHFVTVSQLLNLDQPPAPKVIPKAQPVLTDSTPGTASPTTTTTTPAKSSSSSSSKKKKKQTTSS
jgi:peptidoglycan/xylan/chitin deacetylase (PgdA/CDA1 family)